MKKYVLDNIVSEDLSLMDKIISLGYGK